MSGCGGDSLAFNEGSAEHVYTTFQNSYGAADQFGLNAGSQVEMDLDGAVTDAGLAFSASCLFADDTDDAISGCSIVFYWGNGQVQSLNSITPGLNDFNFGAGGPGLMIQGVR
jgi:hypothetical protein